MFHAILELNANVICVGSGQNKKDAKFHCAKDALSLIAPKIYKARWTISELEFNTLVQKVLKTKRNFSTALKKKEQEKDGGDSGIREEFLDDADLAQNIVISDPRLIKMTHLFEPYAPYTYLK